jgi:hypothetical protein
MDHGSVGSYGTSLHGGSTTALSQDSPRRSVLRGNLRVLEGPENRLGKPRTGVLGGLQSRLQRRGRRVRDGAQEQATVDSLDNDRASTSVFGRLLAGARACWIMPSRV